MNKVQENKKRNTRLILIILILVQAVYISVFFGIRKQGYHSDELWNYGFSNSSDGMHVYTQDDINLYNCLEWVDSKNLLEYISVDKSEIFDYYSVYKNTSRDLNPPLQNMLLHFICSLFPDVWSKWFCFIINIAAFIITQIYLFKFLYEITDNELVSYAGVFIYGFGIGIINISSFLRIYALGVAFIMMFMYYSYMVFKNRDDNNAQKKHLIKASVACLLGSLTVHLFLSIAFIIVFMFSLFYLFSKRIKLLFKYGLASAFSVGAALLMFPSAITHMFDNSGFFEKKKYPTGWQFKIYWSFITKDISGFHNSALYTMTKYYVFVGIIIAAFILIPLCFISRNETWFKALTEKIKSRAKTLWSERKNFPYIIIVLLVSINFFVFIDAAHTSVPKMGIYSRRYVFLVYPLYAALFVILIFYFIKIFISNKKIINTIIMIISLASVSLTYVYSKDFFSIRHEEAGISFDKIEKDANCIILFNEIWVLTCATNELYDTNSYYAAMYINYEQDNYADNLDTDKPLYLILDISTFVDTENIDNLNGITLEGGASAESFGFRTDKKEILEYYENLPISTKLELVGIDTLYDRVFEIYRLN